MKMNSVINKKTIKDTVEGYYVQIEQWLSELDFVSDEIRFFKKVVYNYLKEPDAELKEKIEQVKKEISGVEQKSDTLKSEVLQYRQAVEKDPPQETDIPVGTILSEKLGYLQSKFNSLNGDVRSLKEDLFSITEDIYGN